MDEMSLKSDELNQLLNRVFQPSPRDRTLLILVDLPAGRNQDHEAWSDRRTMASDWFKELSSSGTEDWRKVSFCCYQNVGANNADLPDRAWLMDNLPFPQSLGELDPGDSRPFVEILSDHALILAPTEFSATAPLKILSKKHRFRAATMGGFSPAMIPALRLDYEEVNRRVHLLKKLLDEADSARVVFRVDGDRQFELTLDLRERLAHASGGLLPEPGMAGNLPSGEAYIVPYEGEINGNPSGSHGKIPVQFGPDLVVYEILENRAVSVDGEGKALISEARRLELEPAYGNLAELGLGVLDDFGIKPCGSILLDEKLGLHIAFGRSDHFGGFVGPGEFSSPQNVVHIDRVYIPSIQPRVELASVDLMVSSSPFPLMEKGKYVINFDPNL
jgi:hypothetical protein